MKKMAFLLGVSFLILLMGQARATYTQTLYYYNVSSDTQFNTTGYASINPLNGTCNTTLSVYADVTSTPSIFYNYQVQIIENGTTLITLLPLSGTQPKTCENLGSFSISKGVVNVTARATALAGTQNVTLYLEIHTSCGTNNNLVYINGTIPYANRSYEYNMYSFEYLTNNPNASNTISVWSAYTPNHCTKYREVLPVSSSVNWIINQMNTPLFGFCAGAGTNRCDYNGYAQQTGLSGATKISPMWFVPFNSKLGQAQFDVEFPTTSTIGGLMGIFNPLTQTLIFSQNFGFPTTYASVNVSLEQFKDYIAFFSVAAGSGGSYAKPPVMNITILDYTPSWNCTVIVPCTNGTRQLLCNDTGGILPPEIIPQSCLAANQTIYLGFEDSAPKMTSECIVNSYCVFQAVNQSYGNPENPHWEISPNNVIIYPPNQTQGSFYGGGMTGSESFTANGTTITVNPIAQPWNRGTNFLKLWYEPPFYTHAFFEPNTSTFQCGNSSFGLQSISYFEYVNATFLAALNFTFPSSTMSMFIDVRKCPATQIQYTPPFYCLLAGGQACYGSCSAEPLGNYFVYIFDATTATVVYTYNDISIKENWTTIWIDTSNIINQNHDYRLILGVSPPNGWIYDTNSYCSYFDNVRLFNRATSTKDDIAIRLFGKPYDQLTPDEKAQVDNRYCTPPSQCVGNDRYENNLVNGICTSKVFTNDANCTAQQQAQIISGNQSIFLPISSIADSVVSGNVTFAQSLKAQGLGFILLFITPIFWLMLIVIGGMTGTALLSKHMEIGIASGIMLLIAEAIVFPELIWITIVVIVIAGFITGRYVVKAVSGGG